MKCRFPVLKLALIIAAALLFVQLRWYVFDSVVEAPDSKQWKNFPFNADQADLAAAMEASVAHLTQAPNPQALRVALLDTGDYNDVAVQIETILSQANVSGEPIAASDLSLGELRRFDVVIVPGGPATGKLNVLGDAGKSAIARFISDGGGYVGICGGAYLATSGYLDLVGVRSIPASGGGRVRLAATDVGSRVLGAREFEIHFGGGPLFVPLENNCNYHVLAYFASGAGAFEEQMAGTPAILAARLGKGRIVIFSPHPELTDGCEGILLRAIAAVVPE